jgi:hypothetical protein
MSDGFDAMRFSSPSLERLKNEERKAEGYFGSEYEMSLATNEFAKKMTLEYNDPEVDEIPVPIHVVPVEPVELFPFVDGRLGADYDSLDELYEQLTEGSAVLKFNAYHQDLNPENVDLKSVEQGLENLWGFENDRPSKEEFMDSKKESAEVWSRESNTKVDRPLKNYVTEVPLEMEDAEFFHNKYKDVLEAILNVEDIGIDGYHMWLAQEGRDVEDLHNGLRGKRSDGRVTKLNIDVSYDPTKRVEIADIAVNESLSGPVEELEQRITYNPDRQSFAVGITNGKGLEDYSNGESAVRVSLDGHAPGEHRPKADEMAEALEEQDLPVENWNGDPE